MDEVAYGAAGGVARVTIDRPERRNALSPSAITKLRQLLERARRDDSVRVVVLTGAGDRAFCAGADLTVMVPEGDPGQRGLLDLHEERADLAGLFQDLWELGKPTIARVRGFALAGGFGLALACDFVVASEDAVFGTPEIEVGLWPYMITVPMVRSMPPKVALELMLTARRVGAEEGARIGFVNRVVSVADLDRAVDELAGTLASKPPATVRLGRDAFYAVWDMAAADALRYLHGALTITTLTDDAREGVAAFTEKRPPRWQG